MYICTFGAQNRGTIVTGRAPLVQPSDKEPAPLRVRKLLQ